MFSLSAAPVTFIGLLLLFTFSTVWEAVRLARATDSRGRISSALHLLMSLVMLAMVPTSWYRPFSRVVPIGVQIALMVVGLAWFAVLALRATAGHRSHAAGCAVMFAAMVWHLGAMHLHMSHPMTMAGMDHSAMHGTGHSSMPGMDHSAMPGMGHSDPTAPSWMETASRPGGTLWWLAVVGLVLMAALLWLAVRALVAATRTSGTRRLDHLADLAMNFGMFWMSTGLLAPVLPWITALRF